MQFFKDVPSAKHNFLLIPHQIKFLYSSQVTQLMPHVVSSAPSAIFLSFIYLTNFYFPSKLRSCLRIVTAALSQLAEFPYCVFMLLLKLLQPLSYCIEMIVYSYLSEHLFLLSKLWATWGQEPRVPCLQLYPNASKNGKQVTGAQLFVDG